MMRLLKTPPSDLVGARYCGQKMQTFQQTTGMHLCFDPSMPTWQSNAGTQHVIEYIAVSDSISRFHRDFGFEYDFDCMYDNESRHYGVYLHMTFDAKDFTEERHDDEDEEPWSVEEADDEEEYQ